MLSLQSLSLNFLGGDVGFDLFSIGVIVGQGSMDLCQRQVAYPVCNLLRAQAQLVPAHNAPYRDSSPSDPWASPTHLRRPNYECPDVNYSCHGPYSPLSRFLCPCRRYVHFSSV